MSDNQGSSEKKTNPRDSVLGSLLEGVTIVDLSLNLPGPFCTRLLADLGAHVIKIEPPSGDPTRPLGGLFEALNHDKKIEKLDLKSAKSREKLHTLISIADAMLSSFRPGVLDKFGLDQQTLSKLNPKLVTVSITGYGHSGAWSGKAGHDINFMALSGALDLLRAPSGELAMPNLQIGDLAGGSDMAAITILAGIIGAQRQNTAKHIDVSMAHSLHAHCVLPQATGTLVKSLTGKWPSAAQDLLNGGLPCYRIYETSDNRHMAVGALEHKFWSAFCEAVGKPEWSDTHWQKGTMLGSPESEKMIEKTQALFASQNQDHWIKVFEHVDACVTPVLSLPEAKEHPLFSQADRHKKTSPWQLVD